MAAQNVGQQVTSISSCAFPSYFPDESFESSTASQNQFSNNSLQISSLNTFASNVGPPQPVHYIKPMPPPETYIRAPQSPKAESVTVQSQIHTQHPQNPPYYFEETTQQFHGGVDKGSSFMKPPKPKMGFARDQSLRLGDVLNDTTIASRKLPNDMNMSISLGDIDSGLSKMLEDSLYLDSHGATTGSEGRSSFVQSAGVNKVASTSAVVSDITNDSAVDVPYRQHQMEASHLASNNPLQSDRLSHIGCESALSFSQLIEFDDSYQPSFKLDED